jgi:hypothetical protein
VILNPITKANFFALLILGLITSQFASADVWVPENEFVGYFDYDGIYTVVGAVKNSEEYAVIPTVEIKIQDGNEIVSQSYTLPAANPSKDIPFKIKFSQVSSKNPILEKPSVTFVTTTKEISGIEVIYDRTLVKHTDGHTSGFIINNGALPVYGIKVYALIHGQGGKLLDVGKSVEIIEKIEPGEKKEFSIYPDPSVASQVKYYSCFAIGDDNIIPMFVMREGKKFEFRYESGAYFDNLKFDDEKNTLALFARNPWPTTVYANFEFPMERETQKFHVSIDGEQINALQSRDDYGNWHVAFNLGPQTSTQILISGFEDGVKPNLQGEFNAYYLLGIIPAAAIIAGIFIQKNKKRNNNTK